MRTLGVIVLTEYSVNSLEIKNVSIHKNEQGKGFGSKLIQVAIDYAKSINKKKLIIGTGNSSLDQLKLYQKLGFELYSIKHNFFVDLYPEPIIEHGIQCKHMIMLEYAL